MPTSPLFRSFPRRLALGAVLAALALPAAAQVKKSSEIHYPPLAALPLPEPQRVVLDNGLVVLLIENHELPLIEATALIHTGTRLDPADKVGLARLAASVLRSGGSQALAGDALDDALESRGAAIELTVASSVARATASSLKEDFPAVLQMMADLLRRPTFDDQKLAVAKNQAITQVARQNDNPTGIAFRQLSKRVYGADSPYGRSETYASLGNIELPALVAWQGRDFHPIFILLGVVGDFDKARMLAEIRQAFGGWPRGPKVAEPTVPFRSAPDPGVFFAEKNDITQATLAMGHLGIRNDDPDYYAIEVANEILSGGFTARLISNLRSKKGLAYTVFGGVQSDWDHPGLAFLMMGTKTASVGAGIAGLLDEARGMKERAPTDEEVARAKEAILNASVFRTDTPGKIMGQRLTFEYFGYPADWQRRYRVGIEAVTPAQVRDAAARRLRPADFSIVVVGPAKGMDRPLTDFGKVTPLDLSIPGAPTPASQGGH